MNRQKPTQAYWVAVAVFLILGIGGTAWGAVEVVRVTSDLTYYYASPCREERLQDCVHTESAEVIKKITQQNETSTSHYLQVRSYDGEIAKFVVKPATYDRAQEGDVVGVYAWRGNMVALDKPGYSPNNPPRNERLVAPSMAAFTIGTISSLMLLDGLVALHARRKKPNYSVVLAQVLLPILGGGVAAIICSVAFMETQMFMFTPFLVTYLWWVWRAKSLQKA